MIRPEFQAKFNPQAKVPHSVIKNEYLVIQQFKGSDDETKTSDRELSQDIVELGIKIQEKLSEAKYALKVKLITIFYSLSNAETEDLDMMELEEMMSQIESARPELVSFLALSTAAKKDVTATSSQKMNTSA